MGVRNGHLTTFWIIAGLGVATMVSGVIGWSSVHVDFEGRTVWGDTVYNALLAFTGDDTFLAPENRWIGFARFAGLATTIYALLAVSVAFLGIQMARLRAAFRRGHSVVIGASEFAVEFAARNGRATVLDTAEALDRLPLRQRSVLLLPERMTATTGTGPVLGLAPREVIFGDADPVVNVERARLWVHGAALSRVRTTQLVLRIEDKSVARDLGLLSDALAKARLISRADLIARSLVTAMAPTALAHLRGQPRVQPRVHVALVGLSSLNLSVAEEIALRCHHPALGDPMVTVVDRDAAAATARIRSERPDLFNPDFGANGFSLNVIQMEASACCAPEQAEKLLQIEQDTPLTAIVIAVGDETRNIGIAMRMRQLQTERQLLRAPAFMQSATLDAIAPRPFDDLTGGIIPFGGGRLDAEDLALEALYETLAEGVHDIWRNAPDVKKTGANAWANLSNADRRSSYRAAMSIVELLYAAGFVPPHVSPLAGLRAEPSAVNAALGNDALIRLLTAAEHHRWNHERRLEGWTTAPLQVCGDEKRRVRDNEKKRHPLIVPFDDLPPQQAAKDENNVKEALNQSVARHEEAPDAPCWRKVFRVGVIGPLAADATALRPGLAAAVDRLLAQVDRLDEATLEVLTPNAPGFDRIAALLIARIQNLEGTGRSAVPDPDVRGGAPARDGPAGRCRRQRQPGPDAGADPRAAGVARRWPSPAGDRPAPAWVFGCRTGAGTRPVLRCGRGGAAQHPAAGGWDDPAPRWCDAVHVSATPGRSGRALPKTRHRLPRVSGGRPVAPVLASGAGSGGGAAQGCRRQDDGRHPFKRSLRRRPGTGHPDTGPGAGRWYRRQIAQLPAVGTARCGHRRGHCGCD